MSNRLHLSAGNPAELLAMLATEDITVPLQTEGRMAAHCERYMAARLLSTLAETDLLQFPLKLQHREKPDFALGLGARVVGVECVVATPEEWARIQFVREQSYPDAMIPIPRVFKPAAASLTRGQQVEVARGTGPIGVWVGGMAAREWAYAMAYVVARKVSKLAAGNYADFANNWLIVQDEWPVPLFREEDRLAAAISCNRLLHAAPSQHQFERIFVANARWLLRILPSPVTIWPICELWTNA